MSFKERISHFWNDTLGVDCPEEVNIENSDRPEDKVLQESLARVEGLEKQYKVSTANSAKGGKGSKAEVVEKVQTDSAKAIEQAEQKVAEQKTTNSREER